MFRSVEAIWLRWFTPEGSMLPTEAEAAQQCADVEWQRAERLAERLRRGSLSVFRAAGS